MNQEIFLYINSFVGKNYYLDKIGINAGEYLVYMLVALVIYMYFVLHKKNETIFAFISMIIALLINQLVGLVYFHNRPFMDNVGVTIKTHVADSSFPSDHTTFMFAIIWSLLLFKSTRKIAIICLPFGIIGAFARVFEGVHYPFDIVGGVVVGLVSSIIVYKLRYRLTIINNVIFKIEKKLFGFLHD